MTTTDRVLEILVDEGGYRELPKPFKVGSLSFDFSHVLVAGDKANDVVIIVELKADSADDAVIRKILALTRALDVMRSKRPVTAVLTSGQLRPEMVQTTSRVCRVLPVGAPAGPNALNAIRDWLSVLLPLRETSSVQTVLDWEGDLRAQIPMSVKGAWLDELLKLAPQGKQAVEDSLARVIRRLVKAALEEDEDHG